MRTLPALNADTGPQPTILSPIHQALQKKKQEHAVSKSAPSKSKLSTYQVKEEHREEVGGEAVDALVALLVREELVLVAPDGQRAHAEEHQAEGDEEQDPEAAHPVKGSGRRAAMSLRAPYPLALSIHPLYYS